MPEAQAGVRLQPLTHMPLAHSDRHPYALAPVSVRWHELDLSCLLQHLQRCAYGPMLLSRAELEGFGTTRPERCYCG